MLTCGALFVTGTDTGVGKTAASAAIGLCLQIRGRSVAPFKPVQTGLGGGPVPDAVFVQRALGTNEPFDSICPYRLLQPLGPAVAARLEGRTIDVNTIVTAFERLRSRYETVLVEGAGGLLVEIVEGFTMADLALRLESPLVIVARPSLGTLNHTTLTIEAARRRGLEAAGVVISDFPPNPGLAEATNPAELLRLTGVPLLGVLPHDPAVDTERGELGSLAHWAVESIGPELGGRFVTDEWLATLSRRVG